MTRQVHDADVIVVGAGTGGLTCAAYLAAAGKKVIAFDRHWVAGGNLTSFTHHGYEFDVGLHYIGDCQPGGLVPSLLEPLGVEQRFLEMDPDGIDTFVFPDFTFRFPRGAEALRARLHETFPDETRAIDSYIDMTQNLGEALGGLTESGLALEALRKMPVRLARFIRHYNSRVGDFIDSLDPSPRLRTLLTSRGVLYAVPPSRASLLLHASIDMHFEKGGYYPEGGGQALADKLVDVVVSNGGEIKLSTPVEQIIVENGRARGVRVRPSAPERREGAQEEYYAPVVVSNADLKRTYLEMVGAEHLPARVVRRARQYRMAPSIFVEYLVIDRDLRGEGYPNTNFWVFDDDPDIDSMFADATAGRIPRETFTYVASASLKDPGNPRVARPGQTSLQLMTLPAADHPHWGLTRGPHAGERYRKNTVYLDRKRQYRDIVVKQAEQAIPGLSESIVHEESATPITYERFMHATGGTSYGLEISPDQFLHRRPTPVTPIKGLHLCGSNTLGHGVVMCMFSGMMAATIAEGGRGWASLARGLLMNRLTPPISDLQVAQGETDRSKTSKV